VREETIHMADFMQNLEIWKDLPYGQGKNNPNRPFWGERFVWSTPLFFYLGETHKVLKSQKLNGPKSSSFIELIEMYTTSSLILFKTATYMLLEEEHFA